jgi:putative flavoprotein involved in K+ transport
MAMDITNQRTRNAARHDPERRLMERVDVAIIGGGQAGLSLSYYLKQQGRDHVILERSTRLAEPWRSGRWDSFTLVTPNWTLLLPGFHYAGDEPDAFMPKADVIRYFEDYVASFGPPMLFGIEVSAVDPDPTGNGFVVSTNAGRLMANSVVIATGAHQQALLPDAASRLPGHIVQMHSGEYRNPEALPPGAVLVVGTAQSGAQIAEELSRCGREVYLSVSGAGRAPRRYRGKDVVWWLKQVGFFDTPWDLAPEPKSRFESPPHVSGAGGGRTLNLHQFARDGVHLLGRVRGADDGTILLAPDLHENLGKADGFAAFATNVFDQFIAKSGLDAPPADGEPELRDGFDTPQVTELDLARAGITSVIWATGYGLDFNWVHFPVFEDNGFPIQNQGVTNVPGLYFLGLFWLYTRGSGGLFGVSKDAEHVADVMSARAGSKLVNHLPIAS